MNNINKSLSINETYIIDSIDGGDIFSACTALYTNNIISCSGNTQINLGDNLIVFNGNTLATIISATTYYGDGSNLTGISTQDTFVTGGTYSNGTAVFTNNTGGTFAVSGFYTGTTTPFDVFVTGGTYSNGVAIFTNNTGGTFSVTGFSISNATQFTGGTVTGETFFTNGVTATTISATTYLGLPIATDIFVTGGTYSDGTTVFTNNSGNTFNVTGFTTPFTGGTVSGPTIFTGGLTANTFALSTTPATNTTDTDVLVLNQSTGIVEQRGVNSLTKIVNLVKVGLTGSTGVDYYSIKEAVDSITGASATNTYVVKVGPGVFYEDPITMKSYVDVIGESETNTIIQANNANTSLIIGADQSMVSDVQIQGCTGTGVSAVIYSSPTTPQLNAIFYVENVRFGANYTHAKTVGTGGGNCIMQCSNVKYGGYPFTLGFYVTNDGSGVGRMQLRNVTSTNGGVTTTSGLVFAKADQPSCAFIVNGCLLTKASGAAAGTGFWVENGGSLRLTGVNFQRWTTGIYAPQTGSAPSIEAIALNFENCTTNVNIIHSGATGKVQGTDNYLKTLININAPLYEVNQDPRIITVAKKGGDFASVKSAVDSITGSSENNRFLISVGPGKFIENEIDLTSKPYVSIEGSNIITTQIVPNTNAQHIFKIGQNNEISFLALSGAPSGYAGIYVYDIGDYAQAHKISFNDCDTNVWVESQTQDTKFFGEYLDFNGSYSYGTKIIANNGYLAYANMENYYNYPTGTGTTIANHVQGSGATLSAFIADGIGNGVSGSTNYQILDYASLNTISTTSDGWDYGVRNLNIGGPSTFDVDSLSIVNSYLYDLSVEHPSTFGTYGGSSTHTKINNLSNNVYWAFLDTIDGEFEVTRKISVTFLDGTHTDASTLIFESSTMGLIDGGVITHVSGFTFEISSGFGYLGKTVGNEIYMRIDWPTTQITLLPNNESYLYFNKNEILSASGSAPDSTNNIILGRVVTDSSTVRFIDSSPYIARHTSNLFSDFNRTALGPIYATGSIVTENVTPYHLNISSGDYYYSENNFKPSGGTDVSFVQYYRDNITGWTTTGTTEVVNGYDDNSSTISPLPLSSFTKHTLYVVGEGVNETYMLVLGQTTYSTLLETEGAELPTPPNYFDDSVAPIASIFIQQGMSGITQIQDIRPVIGFKAAGVSASAVHANLLGLSADDHTQYLLVNGNRAMTGNLSMGGNAIVSALTVNGVTVESHASRHKNGGADEIATATPSASEIPKADTFGKLDGWISDASTTVKGLTRLSSSPASATVPIAVGVNDPRFLSSITGVTNTIPSLVFSNNSGGTTTISTLSLSSISATTISATTYVGLPTDIRVTGGTYSAGTTTFRNNTGGTFSVTGFTTPFTGGTVSGATRFTGGLTANTISATTYFNLPTDIRVTGGTYVSGTGITTFSNNTGGTFNVSGYFKPTDDIYVTNGTVDHGPNGNDDNRITLGRNNATSVTISNLVNIAKATKTEMDALSGKYIRGKTYKISQCDTSLYYNGIDKKGDSVYTDIYLMGLEADKLSESGVGVFYTPKYDSISIFIDGDSYAPNSKVIWGGFVWETKDSSSRPSIDAFTLDPAWDIKLPFQNNDLDTDNYNIRYDDIIYDYPNDRIIYRNEENTNIVSTTYKNIVYWIDIKGFYNPIKAFQWGNVYGGTLGIGNQRIINSYNENINYTGNYQINFNFEDLSYLRNNYVETGSYQSNFYFKNNSYQINSSLLGDSHQTSIVLTNNSYITDISFDGGKSGGSYQDTIILDNGSYLTNITLVSGCYQSFIRLNTNSYFSNILFSDDVSYQNELYFDNGSYMEDITFISGASFQENFNFNNHSYQSIINFGDSCFQSNFNFDNESYLSNINLQNIGKSSNQSYFNFDNNSYQDGINVNSETQEFFDFTNNSNQTNSEVIYQGYLIFDSGYQYGNQIYTQDNITIKNYGRDLTTQSAVENDLFFINDLPFVKTDKFIGKIGNQLIEVDGLTYDGSKFLFTQDVGGSGTLSFGTISGATYLGLPLDIRVTGGTYNSGTSTATFTNNTGGTFSVSGFSAGGGATFTGGTVSGATIFTNGLTANTFSATTYLNLPTDIRVTGGTYNSGSSVITFTNNTGGTFTVTGITATGGGSFTGGTVSGATRFTGGLTANTISATTLVLNDIYAASGGTNAGSLLDLSQTWNTSGAPTAFKLNVTNTASGGSAKIMDVQLAGSSVFAIDRSGNMSVSQAIRNTAASTLGGLVQVNPFNAGPILELRYGTTGYQTTSGIVYGLQISQGTNYSSGTNIFNAIGFTGTIIQGTGTGTTRGLYIAPTLTSAFDFRAIEFTNNTGYGIYQTGTAKNSFSGATTFTGGLTANTITSPSISTYGLIVATSMGYQNMF